MTKENGGASKDDDSDDNDSNDDDDDDGKYERDAFDKRTDVPISTAFLRSSEQ